MADIPDMPNVAARAPSKAGGRGAPPPPAAKPTAAQKKDEVLREDLAQLYTLGGVMLSLVRPDIGSSMVEHGEEAAERWVELAAKNTRVRKALEDLTAASVWGAVIAVHVKMLAPAIAFLPTPAPKTPAPKTGEGRSMVLDPDALDIAMQMMNGLRGDGTSIADTVTV
jgi:hypothetical protein